MSGEFQINPDAKSKTFLFLFIINLYPLETKVLADDSPAGHRLHFLPFAWPIHYTGRENRKDV